MKRFITNGNRRPNKIRFNEPYVLLFTTEVVTDDGEEITYTYNMNRMSCR